MQLVFKSLNKEIITTSKQRVYVYNDIQTNILFPVFMISRPVDNVADSYITYENSSIFEETDEWSKVTVQSTTNILQVDIPDQHIFECEIKGDFQITGTYKKVGQLIYQFGSQTLSIDQLAGTMYIRNVAIYNSADLHPYAPVIEDDIYLTYNVNTTHASSLTFQFYTVLNSMEDKTLFNVPEVTEVKLSGNQLLIDGTAAQTLTLEQWNMLCYDFKTGKLFITAPDDIFEIDMSTIEQPTAEIQIGHNDGAQNINGIISLLMLINETMNKDRFTLLSNLVQQQLNKTLV